MNTTHKPAVPIALVLGISGAVGGAIAKVLAARGYRIRALARATSSNRSMSFPIDWVEGDALEQADVINAARGVEIIVHGVNPPGYAKWRELAIPMLGNSISAARVTGATILFPANIYVFSPAAGPRVDETTPMAPTTRKGRVRLEMEMMLADAAEKHGVRTIAVRSGDFFGPGVVNSWFAQAVAKGGRSARVLHDLSSPGVGHAWAYVPDLAETFGRLVDCRASLATYEMVHFHGHWTDPGRTIAETAYRVIGRSELRIRSFPWIIMYGGAPFVTFLREAMEMRWLWRHPLRLDNSKLERLIGPEPRTPLERAIAAAFDEPLADETTLHRTAVAA
jgi:nucleoside-diphosphate-sugar epimerase